MRGSLSAQGFMCSTFAFWVYSVSSSFVLRTPISRQVRLFQFSVPELALALFWPCCEAVPLFLERLRCSFNTGPLRLVLVTFYYRSSPNLSRPNFRKAYSEDCTHLSVPSVPSGKRGRGTSSFHVLWASKLAEVECWNSDSSPFPCLDSLEPTTMGWTSHTESRSFYLRQSSLEILS